MSNTQTASRFSIALPIQPQGNDFAMQLLLDMPQVLDSLTLESLFP